MLGLALLGRRRAFLSHDVMRRGGWGVAPSPAGYKRLIVRGAQAAGPLVRKARLDALLKGPWRRAKSGHRLKVKLLFESQAEDAAEIEHLARVLVKRRLLGWIH